MRRRSKTPPKPPPPEPRINERIRVPEVRLIDEEGRQVGVVRTADAITMARERDVDLVEVAAQANPPVARLMDFGRFKYEQSKKDREAKKHQTTMALREIRMKAKIDDHDIDFKTRTAHKLLLHGDKVKVSVMFRGREIVHPQIGKNLLERILGALEEIAAVEKEPSLEGRHMTMILIPDKKKIAAQQKALDAEASAEEGEDDASEDDDEAVAVAAAAAPVVGDESSGEDNSEQEVAAVAEVTAGPGGD
ncbi:MAG TPA: translation initiation factor IF-3 [Dehalococcoidia bacterium]|nr:translation initiation factor IF-3 [Dehalococcoidia bacterium]